MTRRLISAVGSLSVMVLLHGCGKGVGPGGPSPIPSPSVSPNTLAVTFTAFLDENGNRVLDSNEVTRIPNVEIVAGTVKGRTAAVTGQATLQLPEGAQPLEVNPASLPPFYRPPSSTTLAVPATGPVMVPITLPVGSNRPNVYMAFGDSITNGEPEVGDMNGYRLVLQTMLRTHFGAGTVVNEGLDATNSDRGAERIGGSLSRNRPAFTLIHYGTNDWNTCHSYPCDMTIDSLRSMVQQVNQSGGHAFLATILPVNVGWDGRAPEERNDWVANQNAYIRQVADQEGAVLVDISGAYLHTSLPNSALFVDHIHPTFAGYQIMAQTWFDAITKAYSKILSAS